MIGTYEYENLHKIFDWKYGAYYLYYYNFPDYFDKIKKQSEIKHVGVKRISIDRNIASKNKMNPVNDGNSHKVEAIMGKTNN